MPATATYIADLLEHHLEELGFLWGQWRAALTDPDYSLKGVGELEERIRGHADGVRVPGDAAWPRVLELLDADDPDLAFAAAYSLLDTGSAEHAGAVIDAFERAEADALGGLRTALAYGRLDPAALERVRGLLSAQPTDRAVAVAEVLAFHGSLGLGPEDLRYFLGDEDAAVRIAGWRVVGLGGVRMDPKAYAAALRDDEPSVATAAIAAGAWCGEHGVLAALRHMAESPTPERLAALELFAILGGPEDLPRISALVGTPDLGPERFRLAGAYGAPALMEAILAGLEDADPATAAAAGAAFTRLTGEDIESDERVSVAPAGGEEPDEFEEEFLDEIALPDPSLARERWAELEPRLGQATRICRGTDASALAPDPPNPEIDMESRWERHLRAKFHGAWDGSRLDLERFPQVAG